jgi:hypothetical protein
MRIFRHRKCCPVRHDDAARTGHRRPPKESVGLIRTANRAPRPAFDTISAPSALAFSLSASGVASVLSPKRKKLDSDPASVPSRAMPATMIVTPAHRPVSVIGTTSP